MVTDPPDVEEEHLLAAFRDDDPEVAEEAFRQLFRRFRKPLLAFFSRRGFRSEISHELSQETFLRVYRSRHGYRAEVPVASWIFTIAANVYRNELRRRQAGKRSGEETPLEACEEPEVNAATILPADSEERLLERERSAALVASIDRLPPQMARVLKLRVGRGYSLAETARLMKLSESTVRVHLHQARKRLRRIPGTGLDDLPS